MPSPEPLPGIGRPATGALAAIGITTLDQLAGRSRRELLALHGVGPKAVRVIEAALAERGLGLVE
ncbi:DNA-binding protein [Blastococcus sp. SYSU D00820]